MRPKAIDDENVILHDWGIKAKSRFTPALCFIPNRLDFRHKIIIPGVHEIASLVVKITFVKSLGINRI